MMKSIDLSTNSDREYLFWMADKWKLDLVYPVLNNPDFYIWSGSSKPEQHHYGTGGLVRHTVEVLRLVEQTLKTLPCKSNPQVVLTATNWHDYGKLWDYEQVDGVWRATSHKRIIHHISKSAIEWSKAAANCPDKDFVEQVTHFILSHHGRREWGSPVMPLSEEAWILHLADSISARVNDCCKQDLTKRDIIT